MPETMLERFSAMWLETYHTMPDQGLDKSKAVRGHSLALSPLVLTPGLPLLPAPFPILFPSVEYVNPFPLPHAIPYNSPRGIFRVYVKLFDFRLFKCPKP